ncbi:hypothetical protein ACFQ1I_27710 [Kitasatospora arboriphila]
MRWAVDAVPATLNVYQPAADADSELIARALLPGLFRLDDRGRATLDPDYLASAESTPARPQPADRHLPAQPRRGVERRLAAVGRRLHRPVEGAVRRRPGLPQRPPG